ncbi:MAG: hypothetical protein ACYTFG_08395, partial [Planctomycetota bacterium]
VVLDGDGEKDDEGGFAAAMAEARKNPGRSSSTPKRATTKRRKKGGTTLQPRRQTTTRRKVDTEKRSKGTTTVRKRGDTEHRSREGGPPIRGGRSKTPLILGLGAAAALAAVALILAMTMGGNGGETPRGGGKKGRKGADERVLTDRERPSASPEKKVREKPEPDRKYVLPGEFDEYALEKDIPEALVLANGKMVDPKRYEELQAIEKAYRDEVTAEINLRRDDPFYDAVQQVKSSFLTRKGLDQFKFKVNRSKPYVVFEHLGNSAADLEGEDPTAERNLEHKLRMLKHAFKEVKGRWMDPFGLSMNPRIPLILIALKDRQAFKALSREFGMNIPDGVLGYFMPRTGYIVIYNGSSPGASKRARSESNGTIYHEGVHQIVNAFVNKGRSPDSTNYVYIPWWVSEGLAEYVGSVRILDEKDSDGYELHEICIPNPGRLFEFWMARHPLKRTGIPPYHLDLANMIECFTQQDIVDRVKRNVGDQLKAHSANSPRWQRVQSACVSMMYAEASSFFLFCYEFGGGKYADAMNRFLKRTYEGYNRPEHFKEAFGVTNLDTLHKEWMSYIDSVTPERIKNRFK